MNDTMVRPTLGGRVHLGDPLHFKVVEFLEDEATLLDQSRLLEWVQLMTTDIVYRLPVRQTRLRDDRADQFVAEEATVPDHEVPRPEVVQQRADHRRLGHQLPL